MAHVATQNAPEAKQSIANLPKEAINRTYRGDKEGKIQLQIYPDFWTKTDEESLLKKRQYVKVGCKRMSCRWRGMVAGGAWLGGSAVVLPEYAVGMLLPTCFLCTPPVSPPPHTCQTHPRRPKQRSGAKNVR